MSSLRSRLRQDWTELRPFKQALFVVIWSITVLGAVWLIPRGWFPVDPELVYQGQVLVTALVAGAFVEPVITALQYDSLEAWEADVNDVDLNEWEEHLEEIDAWRSQTTMEESDA